MKDVSQSIWRCIFGEKPSQNLRDSTDVFIVFWRQPENAIGWICFCGNMIFMNVWMVVRWDAHESRCSFMGGRVSLVRSEQVACLRLLKETTNPPEGICRFLISSNRALRSLAAGLSHCHVNQDEGRHAFDHRDRPRQNTGIMATTRFEFGVRAFKVSRCL